MKDLGSSLTFYDIIAMKKICPHFRLLDEQVAALSWGVVL